MVRVGEDQEILTLEPCHVRSWNGRQCSRSITETKAASLEPSHRFTGAYQSLFLRLFGWGIDHPLNTSKTAYKRFKMITPRDYPNILTISVLWLLMPLSALFRYPSNRLNQFCAGVTKPSTHKKDGDWLFETINNEEFILILVYRYNESQHGDLILNLM